MEILGKLDETIKQLKITSFKVLPLSRTILIW